MAASRSGSSAGPVLAAFGLGRRPAGSSRWLLRQIDLEVYAGERLVLVGPTGSGKSLVLRSLALLDAIDEGEILWQGQPVDDRSVPEFRSQIVYLQQRSPLIAGTVDDNLQLPFRLRSHSDTSFPRQRAIELLTAFGKQRDFLASSTGNLSGGERQMVALVRALLIEPRLLLLDEPSAALDPRTTAQLEELVELWFRQSRADRAYIWVSHDASQADRVGDRSIRLQEGRLLGEP